MKTKEFLAEFDNKHFPSPVGPEISLYEHDPPFTRAHIRQMERQNLIAMTRDNTHYQLALKATKVRSGVA